MSGHLLPLDTALPGIFYSGICDHWMEVLSSVHHPSFGECSSSGLVLSRGKHVPFRICYPYLPSTLCANWLQTRGLSLEEINGLFGDTVAVRLTHLTAEEKDVLDARVLRDAGCIESGSGSDGAGEGETPDSKGKSSLSLKA